MLLATRTLVSFAAVLLVDRYYQILDCRLGVAIATCFTAAGFATFSIANSLPLFFAGAILCGLGYGLGGMVGMTLLTRRWYPQGQIGSAVGFATVGSGMALFIIPSIAVRIIENVSLHASFLFEAIAALTVALIALLFIRNRPKDRSSHLTENAQKDLDSAQRRNDAGSSPAGVPANNNESNRTHARLGPVDLQFKPKANNFLRVTEPNGPQPKPRSSDVLRTPEPNGSQPITELNDGQPAPNSNNPQLDPKQSVGAHISQANYRLLIFSMVLVGMISVGGPAYVTVYFTDNGMDPILAATLLSVQGAFLAIFKFTTGRLFDIIGTRKGSTIMFAVEIVGLVAMCLAISGNTAIAIAAVVLYGAGVSLGSVGVSVWSLELASPKNKIRSIKNYQVAYSIGGFVVNTFPGPLKELTGTYLSTYVVLAIGACIACAIIVGTYFRKRRYVVTR